MESQQHSYRILDSQRTRPMRLHNSNKKVNSPMKRLNTTYSKVMSRESQKFKNKTRPNSTSLHSKKCRASTLKKNKKKDQSPKKIARGNPIDQKYVKPAFLQNVARTRAQIAWFNPEEDTTFYDNQKRFDNLRTKLRFYKEETKQQRAKRLFPNAMKYYRNSTISKGDQLYLDYLENLLTRQKIFVDEKNPRVKQGSYQRPSQYFRVGERIRVLPQQLSGTQMHKVCQGRIGNCYFISALSALAYAYPQYLASRFLFEVNPVHYYAVRLFVHGEWSYVTTDDQLPFFKQNKLVYLSASTPYIWPMLLQKCCAKVFGSYSALSSGSSVEALRLLTGSPFSIQKVSCLEDIKSYINSGYLLNISSKSIHLSDKQMEEAGIDNDHSYSVLRFVEVNDGRVLFKLRNPWGRRVWNQNFSQWSKSWTIDLRRQCGTLEDPKDGSFWMEGQDLIKYFRCLEVSKFNPQYIHTTHKILMEHSRPSFIEVTVKTTGQYYLTLCQEFQRKFRNDQKQQRAASQSRMIIMQKSNDKLIFKDATLESHSQACQLDLDCVSGQVLVIRANIDWIYWPMRECVISAYGADKVSFKTLNYSKNEQLAFESQLCQNYAIVREQQASASKQPMDDKPDCYNQMYFSDDNYIGYLRVINSSTEIFVARCVLEHTNIIPMKMVTSSQYVFCTLPGSTETIGFYIVDEDYTFEIQFFQLD